MKQRVFRTLRAPPAYVVLTSLPLTRWATATTLTSSLVIRPFIIQRRVASGEEVPTDACRAAHRRALDPACHLDVPCVCEILAPAVLDDLAPSTCARGQVLAAGPSGSLAQP